ncbi:hypothetical protein [Methanoregula sp.]|uniref:hypothetical protein n=1 Tax=Methanoregula sp. TaxID=2052170 RepID=UPI00261E7C30|nr:hypothetical protein [Methanoregula sp.]MDD5142505.1 hypothetical protein [Methanoregula sp.]
MIILSKGTPVYHTQYIKENLDSSILSNNLSCFQMKPGKNNDAIRSFNRAPCHQPGVLRRQTGQRLHKSRRRPAAREQERETQANRENGPGNIHNLTHMNDISMTEIVLNVPDDLPLPGLVARLERLIEEEHLKWMLFSKSVDVIALDDKDQAAFEKVREQAWNGTKKEFGL